MAFEDQNKIRFTKALIDAPSDAWIIKWPGEVGVGVPNVIHKKSKHEWALDDWDDASQSWQGTRIDQQ